MPEWNRSHRLKGADGDPSGKVMTTTTGDACKRGEHGLLQKCEILEKPQIIKSEFRLHVVTDLLLFIIRSRNREKGINELHCFIKTLSACKLPLQFLLPLIQPLHKIDEFE